MPLQAHSEVRKTVLGGDDNLFGHGGHGLFLFYALAVSS